MSASLAKLRKIVTTTSREKRKVILCSDYLTIKAILFIYLEFIDLQSLPTNKMQLFMKLHTDNPDMNNVFSTFRCQWMPLKTCYNI